MSFAKTLTRDEMKNVMAGAEGCVGCKTPNGGFETWYRDDIETGEDDNLDEICQSIYPAYEDDSVSGIMVHGGC